MTCPVGSSHYHGEQSSPHDRPLGHLTGTQGASVSRWRHAGSGLAHIQLIRPDARNPRAVRFWTTMRNSRECPVPPVPTSPRRCLHRSRCALDLWEGPHSLGGRSQWLVASWDALHGAPSSQTVEGWLDVSEPTKGSLVRLAPSLDFTAFLEGGFWRVATFQVPAQIRDAMDGVLGSGLRLSPRAIRWSARATEDGTHFQFWYRI